MKDLQNERESNICARGDGKIEISQGFAIKISKIASYPTLLQLLNAKNPLLGIESGRKKKVHPYWAHLI